MRVVKLVQNKPQDLWNRALQTDENKVEIFTHNATASCLLKSIIIPTVKHYGGGVMIWAGPGLITVINPTCNKDFAKKLLFIFFFV